MEQHEMVTLLRGSIEQTGGTWADLGAGTGNFTWALAKLLGATATIYAIDRDQKAIRAQEQRIIADPPAATVIPRQGDATRTLDLPPLDGILTANLLHFIGDQAGMLRRLRAMLRPDGRLVVVEYDQAFPIPWVPHPLPPAHLDALAHDAGFTPPHVIGRRVSPSSGRTMYAASLGLRIEASSATATVSNRVE